MYLTTIASRFPAHMPLLASPHGNSSFRNREPISMKLSPSRRTVRLLRAGACVCQERGWMCVWMRGFNRAEGQTLPALLALSKTYLDTRHKGLAADDDEEGNEERAGQRELHGACLLCVRPGVGRVEKSGEGRQLICRVWKGGKGTHG